MKIIEVLRSFLHKIDAEDAVDYVCGTEALPLPFSPQEEKEMLDKLERGEKEEADEIKGELIKHNLRL
ncbi:MAG: RNA polymerase sporulation sigma factor SigE, partial [Candidatus Scatosoma sp.]